MISQLESIDTPISKADRVVSVGLGMRKRKYETYENCN